MNCIKITKKDIKIFFNGKRRKESSPKRSGGSCQNSPPDDSSEFEYFRRNEKVDWVASTITIGNKYYGMMSAYDQYVQIKKAIKDHAPFRGQDVYYYSFELQKNGQVHAHGITNVYHNRFIEAFHKFGHHNINDLSFQKIKHLDKYIKYINKDNFFVPVHNVTKERILNDIIHKCNSLVPVPNIKVPPPEAPPAVGEVLGRALDPEKIRE